MTYKNAWLVILICFAIVVITILFFMESGKILISEKNLSSLLGI